MSKQEKTGNKKKTVRHDNWQAAEYASASEMQWRHAMEAISRSPYQHAAMVLDVGCGDGKITKLLADKLVNGRVVGIDLTADMIDYASRNYHDVANLSFSQLSADEIDYRNCFDYIFSFSCLHWVADQQSVWQRFYTALKPQGKVTVGFQVGHEHFWGIVYQLMESDEWQPGFQGFADPYNHYTLEEMCDYIHQAGFYLPRIDEIHQVENFETRSQLQAFLISWVPQFRYLSAADQTAFVNKTLDLYYKQIDKRMRKTAGMRIKRYIIQAEK